MTDTIEDTNAVDAGATTTTEEALPLPESEVAEPAIAAVTLDTINSLPAEAPKEVDAVKNVNSVGVEA